MLQNGIIQFEKIPDNIKKEGAEWFNSALFFCEKLSKQYNKPILQTAGVIAAFSPRKEWETNKKIAKEYLSTGKCGTFNLLQQKASLICSQDLTKEETLEILGGRKIKSFFSNIIGDSSSVTVDQHMLNMFGYNNITPNRYNYIEKYIQNFSKTTNFTPCQVQAILWVFWKNQPLNIRRQHTEALIAKGFQGRNGVDLLNILKH